MMKLNAFRSILFSVSLFVLWIAYLSCNTAGNVRGSNLNSIYRTNDNVYHPDFAVYHTSDSTSRCYVRVKTGELLWQRQQDNNFAAFVKIAFRLIDGFNDEAVLDTGAAYFETSAAHVMSEEKVFSFDFKVSRPGKYLLHCSYTDLNRRSTEVFFVPVDNNSKQSRQSFMVSTFNRDLPGFKKYYSESDSITVSCRFSNVKEVKVDFYKRDFPLPSPIFAVDNHQPFDYLADSSFTIEVNSGKYYLFPQKGIYHCRFDENSKEGLSIFRFSKNYPEIKSANEMIEPVRYLVMKKEFEEINTTADIKKSIEKFWLDKSSNPERAKMLIRNYYNRVEDANKFFTSYTEGYRTDRGMVYVVFGIPNIVYKTSTSETWIYGQQNNALSLNLFFTKRENPFSDNDFELNRSPIYESPWYRAVDTWRQGRAYNISPY